MVYAAGMAQWSRNAVTMGAPKGQLRAAGAAATERESVLSVVRMAAVILPGVAAGATVMEWLESVLSVIRMAAVILSGVVAGAAVMARGGRDAAKMDVQT